MAELFVLAVREKRQTIEPRLRESRDQGARSMGIERSAPEIGRSEAGTERGCLAGLVEMGV